MNASRLRNLIDLQHPTDDVGVAAGIAPTYATAYATGIWAAVDDLYGNQLMAAQQAFADVTTRVEIRWMAGVKANDRITTDGGRKLNVIAPIDPDNGKKLRLHLMCKELSDGT